MQCAKDKSINDYGENTETRLDGKRGGNAGQLVVNHEITIELAGCPWAACHACRRGQTQGASQ